MNDVYLDRPDSRDECYGDWVEEFALAVRREQRELSELAESHPTVQEHVLAEIARQDRLAARIA